MPRLRRRWGHLNFDKVLRKVFDKMLDKVFDKVLDKVVENSLSTPGAPFRSAHVTTF